MTVLLVILCPALCVFLSNYVLRQGIVVTLRYLIPRWKIASIGYILFLLFTVIITFVTRKVAVSYFLLGIITICDSANSLHFTNSKTHVFHILTSLKLGWCVIVWSWMTYNNGINDVFNSMKSEDLSSWNNYVSFSWQTLIVALLPLDLNIKKKKQLLD